MKHLMHSLFGLLLVAALAGCSSKGGTTDGELAAVDDRSMSAGEEGGAVATGAAGAGTFVCACRRNDLP